MSESLYDPDRLVPRVVSLSHIGGRSTQQDCIWPPPDYAISFDERADLLLVVADGAGGHRGGEVASRLAIETIVTHYATLRQQEAPQQALLNAIREAHETIQDQQLRDLDKHSMASTVVALLLSTHQKKTTRRYQIRVANVGDSRAYLYRPGFALTQLSQDHTLVQEEVRKQQLTPEQAKIHPLRHRLSQALGGKKELEIFAPGVIQPKPHDRYLLCSDGLTDVVDDARIQAILSKQAPTEQVAQALMKEALLPAEDNVSFILLDMMPLRSDEQENPARNMVPSWRDGMTVMLLFLFLITFMVVVIMKWWVDEGSFAPATLEVNHVTNQMTKIKASPTEIRQQSTVQTVSNQPKATNTALPSPTIEPILTVNPDLEGEAATPIPSPTSVPLPQIVEYRTGTDRIIFESMVGWGGQNRLCYGAYSQLTITERIYYPYEHATGPVEQPIVEQRGADIYVKFYAIAANTRACGLEFYHERVIPQAAQQSEWIEWIIKDAQLTGPVIPLDYDPEISQGGWMIPLRWQ